MLLADIPRVAALVSVVIGALFYPAGAPIVFAVLFAALVGVRLARIAWPFDLALGTLLLLAMWASVADWYIAQPWLDWVMHCVGTGAVGAAVRLLLARFHMLPDIAHATVSRVGLLVTTVSLGATAAICWDFYEWFAGAVGLPQPHVGYDDTIADLLMGTFGSLLAACALLAWRARLRRLRWLQACQAPQR